jgi:hypothetical protein
MFKASFKAHSRFSVLDCSNTSEWENSHSDIGRLINYLKIWPFVKRVAYTGHSDNLAEYSFQDKNLPDAARIVSYQLKQLDFNDFYIYSCYVNQV